VEALIPDAISFNDRPNNLLILADDWDYGVIGCYGKEIIQTPCLDKLAEEGTCFKRFYVTNNVCSLSRCSFITGHYLGRWQVHTHFVRFDTNTQRPLPNWLDHQSPSLPDEVWAAMPLWTLSNRNPTSLSFSIYGSKIHPSPPHSTKEPWIRA